MAYDSARGQCVLFGGTVVVNGSHVDLGDTWIWDGTSWQERVVAGPSARRDHAMAYDPVRQRVVLFGGTNISGGLGETWEWDGTSWTLRSTSGPGFRQYAKIVFDAARSRCVLFGGYTQTLAARDETWEWDGNTWVRVATAGPGRYGHAMAYDPVRNKTVVYGGFVENIGPVGDTWEWNGTAWTQSPATSFGTRRFPEMVFDIARGRV